MLVWNYFEWPFMISMMEKVNRFEILDCKKQLAFMLEKLCANRNEFVSGKFILDFEQVWVEMYVKTEGRKRLEKSNYLWSRWLREDYL